MSTRDFFVRLFCAWMYIYVSAAVVGVYRVLISGVKRIAAAFSRLISVYVCVEIKNC